MWSISKKVYICTLFGKVTPRALPTKVVKNK